MHEIDERLDRMIEIADELNVKLDDVVAAIGRADQRTFDEFSERPSRLPLYMKSRSSP